MATMQVFDRRLLRIRRDRAAAQLSAHDFLFREAAERLTERLQDIKRRFEVALDLGCHGGEVARALNFQGGIETLVQCDLSAGMAASARDGGKSRLALAADEEALPFAAASFDLVLSSLSLHWVNDLPGALLQVRRILRPDGLFLGALLGGETLCELRAVWTEAELAEEGGAGSHVAPFADIRDAGALLQRAGFALPVADAETITVTYPDAHALMADLRGMGEANVAVLRRGFARRAALDRMAKLYKERFGDASGRIPATFQVIYLTAWSPHDSQPKALRPGSAQARLSEALGAMEKPAGDKARP
jgi:NADH dehydrogenase [ubiquinone] 1 alpha subcomplex assembly factor 5